VSLRPILIWISVPSAPIAGNATMDSSDSSSVGGVDHGGQLRLIDRRQKRNGLARGPSASVAARQRRIAVLTRTIETQIAPQLALAHSHDNAGGSGADRVTVVGDAELERFLAFVLANDLRTGMAWVGQRVAEGLGLADICLAVLAPTARPLGAMWDDDRCSFAEVTTALGTLHSMLHRLRQICDPPLPIRDLSRRVLLASASGDQHTFGLPIVAEVFRHSGWDVSVETASVEADLLNTVRGNWFAVVGISIALDQQTAALGRTIRAIRQVSCNRTIGILLGGPALIRRPDLARLAGADGTASNAKQAVLRASSLRLDPSHANAAFTSSFRSDVVYATA
jgi:methanogenic corrinoid protein MtbC1